MFRSLFNIVYMSLLSEKFRFEIAVLLSAKVSLKVFTTIFFFLNLSFVYMYIAELLVVALA